MIGGVLTDCFIYLVGCFCFFFQYMLDLARMFPPEDPKTSR